MLLPPPKQPFIAPEGHDVPLGGLYRGASLFLVLSGPSLPTFDLGLLDQRGIVTMGVNNSPTVVRPRLWVCGDRAAKFHEAIWRDAGVLKFVPVWPDRRAPKSGYYPGHFRHCIQHKHGGQFTAVHRDDGTPAQVGDFPGVIGYRRNSTFSPETWLGEPLVNWGNSPDAAKRNGRPHAFSVMLAAVKIAYLLGFRTVYLLGCDFCMDQGKPYGFAQAKGAHGVAVNRKSYEHLNAFFNALRPQFQSAGFYVFNCNPNSSFATFDHIRFKDAVNRARKDMPPDPLDAEGWYETVEGWD